MDLLARLIVAVALGLAAGLIVWLILAIFPVIEPGSLPKIAGLIVAIVYFLEPYTRSQR